VGDRACRGKLSCATGRAGRPTRRSVSVLWVSGPVLDHALAFDVASDAVGDTFRVVVARCHAVDAIDVPAVYVTDADITLGMTVDTIRYLCLSTAPPLLANRSTGPPPTASITAATCRFLPGVLVVGVGLPGQWDPCRAGVAVAGSHADQP